MKQCCTATPLAGFDQVRRRKVQTGLSVCRKGMRGTDRMLVN